MATVQRLYRMAGPSQAQLQSLIAATAQVVTVFNGPLILISFDDAVAGAQQGADAIMLSFGYVPDSTALDLLTHPDLFGDGSDGDVSLGAGTTTLTRDMFYNNLTIPNGANLNTAHFRVYVKRRMTIDAGGTIAKNGGAGAATGAAGAAVQGGAGSWGAAGAAGGAGQNAAGNNGGASGNGLNGFNGTGGNGGAGAGGANAGGIGGAVTTIAATSGSGHRHAIEALLGVSIAGGSSNARLSQGAGGGGGGGGGAVAGAGGGGGGGGICVAAREIVNNGSIEALGGAGGNASNTNGGGGGGGGGGIILLTYHTFTGNTPSVLPGNGGNGNGTGVAGSNGTAGLYIPLVV